MKNNKNSFTSQMFGVSILIILIGLLSISVFGAPTEPTSIVTGAIGSRDISNPIQAGVAVAAQAGNVTELAISALGPTTAWQGYYGNVSGKLVLDNANNQSFYRWDLASPVGEIYASNSSRVNWTAIQCVNLTVAPAGGLNSAILDGMFGIDPSDSDRFNITFNETYTGSFDVALTTIDSTNRCPMTQLYNGSTASTANWQEVLLWENATRSVIFASFLSNNVNAFDNSSRDFQLLVAENGNNSDTNPTNYYFFVELG